MKDMIFNRYKKQTILLILFIILSLSIWFLGPAWTLANHAPLAQADKRFYIIATVFLLGLLKLFFFDTAPPVKKMAPPLSIPAQKKLHLLHGRFQGALDFLKKTVINKHGNNVSLAHLPWYLLIGPVNSGKTALLTQANINFILSKPTKPDNTPSDSCDWWVTRDAVIIDVPGTYFNHKEKSLKPQETHYLWETLLNLCKTAPSKDKLGGIIISLNLPELMKKSAAQEKSLLIYNLKKRILELRREFGWHIPFHFVLTKCDLLPGFLEFFSDSDSDELAQTWGITLPVPQGKDNLLNLLAHRFNLLIKRINKQLIWRLHQERNPHARPYIKDFPLHLERLKAAVITLTKALAMPDLRLSGIYLTSATQHKTEELAENIQSSDSHLTYQTLQIMRSPPTPARAYFIKQLILQSLLHTASRSVTTVTSGHYQWQRRSIYALSIGIIVTAMLLLGQDFRQSIHQAYAIQNELAHYQTSIQHTHQNSDRLVKSLPLLDALQQAANNSNHPLSLLKSLLSFYSNRSQQTTTAVYHQTLKTIIIPEIQNDLEKYLQTANSKNPVFVYTALKAYLMLTDTSYRQSDFIANTLSKIASTPLNKHAIQQLATHIHNAFADGTIKVTLDSELIATIRKQLSNVPSIELSRVILENIDANNIDSTIDLGTNFGSPPVFISKQIANRIPNMFIADHFQTIIHDEIAVVATEALHGNWVLGNLIPSLNQPSLELLIAQLRSQYIANYVDIWESQLANIQAFTPKNLLQTDEMIQNLTNNDSPLLQLLQTIKQNTSFPPISTASPKIQALNELLTHTSSKSISLYSIFVSLRQLHTYLQTILTATKVDQTAFTTAIDRLQNPDKNPISRIHQLAEQSPEPLKTWLHTIANQSWNFILQEAGHHIDVAWQTEIVPTYQEQIANRYPFNQTSTQEVSLQQFTHFLGHRGQLALFYQAYLKPFVNETNSPWTWKTLDNQKSPFSTILLANLQQAAQIQRIFFPNGDNKLLIQFTLQPLALDPTTKNISLNMNGQQISYQKNAPRIPRLLTWPGNNNALRSTAIHFTSNKNQLDTSFSKGDWSWFRTVIHAAQGLNAQQELVLRISAHNHSAEYLLSTSGSINPFSPITLSHFELPQQIWEH